MALLFEIYKPQINRWLIKNSKKKIGVLTEMELF